MVDKLKERMEAAIRPLDGYLRTYGAARTRVTGLTPEEETAQVGGDRLGLPIRQIKGDKAFGFYIIGTEPTLEEKTTMTRIGEY